MRKVALECECRLKQGDQRYQILVESLKKADHHPKRRELETVKVTIAEKEKFFNQLSALNRKLSVAWNVRSSYAEDNVKKLLRVPKVEFDRFTEQSSFSLANIFWLSKE